MSISVFIGYLVFILFQAAMFILFIALLIYFLIQRLHEKKEEEKHKDYKNY